MQVEKGHTSREFDRELRNLRDKLLAMGGRAEEQIGRAVQALIKRDDKLADQVVADDEAIDQAEIGIGDLAVNIAKRVRDLARFAPSPMQDRIELLATRVLGALQMALVAFVHAAAERAEKV